MYHKNVFTSPPSVVTNLKTFVSRFTRSTWHETSRKWFWHVALHPSVITAKCLLFTDLKILACVVYLIAISWEYNILAFTRRFIRVNIDFANKSDDTIESSIQRLSLFLLYFPAVRWQVAVWGLSGPPGAQRQVGPIYSSQSSRARRVCINASHHFKKI